MKVLKPAKRGKISLRAIKTAVKLVKAYRRFTVRYLGEPRAVLDIAFTKIALERGYEFYASGYNFKTNVRDIVFEEKIPL